MADPGLRDITGLILAGGRAMRMGGVDKGLIEFEGRPLIEHVVERLRPQVSALIISANRNAERYVRYGARVVADAAGAHESFAGPLAGMLAGMRAAPTGWIACVPCDAPFVPLDLVARLAQGHGAAPAALARTADGLQPVFCLLRKDLAEDLARALRAGVRKTETWLAAVGAASVAFDDAAAFANLNTLDDLKRDDEAR